MTRQPGCSTCRYVCPTSQGFECHRYPPALLSTVQGTTQLHVGWPEVRATALCGEWTGVEWKPVESEATPPETPKRGMDAADLAFHAEASGRAKEREDVINWLTEAQFHVITQDEVRVILKLREQFKAGRHVPKLTP